MICIQNSCLFFNKKKHKKMWLKMWITCITPCITSFYGIFRGNIVDNFSTCFPRIPQEHMFPAYFLCILLFTFYLLTNFLIQPFTVADKKQLLKIHFDIFSFHIFCKSKYDNLRLQHHFPVYNL